MVVTGAMAMVTAMTSVLLLKVLAVLVVADTRHHSSRHYEGTLPVVGIPIARIKKIQ